MVVSNRFSGKEALQIYRQGWGNERLFGHLKKNGFDLEATHMTGAPKLEILFALTVLAFLFSFAWGCRFRESTRKMTAAASRKSVFRLGLEDLMSLFDQSNPDPSQEAGRSEFWLWLPSETFHSIFLVSCATPTKEAHHEVGRPDHDFTQHSVIRSTNERREEPTDWNGARVEGLGADERPEFGEGPT